MYGAILGDIIGSPYEFDRGRKTKKFPLFSKQSEFTDDTVMTIAIAEAMMRAGLDADEDTIREYCIRRMQAWGKKYPDAGYGGRFGSWLRTPDPEPYGSFGNGSAMRVSAVGWLYDDLERTQAVARATADVTHDHVEGIKGAEATAAAIFMARTGSTKEEIKAYICEEFQYDLSRTCAEIRPYYHHVESCQETVPEAITAFLEGNSFEDVIRTAVSLGGDCDTLTAIAGSIAEAYYGVPENLIKACENRLSEDILSVLRKFNEVRKPRAKHLGEAEKEKYIEMGENLAQAIYPGIAMFARDVNLPQKLAEKYTAGRIIREKAFTDASIRFMGMPTTHRFVILSNHMANLAKFEHGTNWGLHTARKDSHFKVLGQCTDQGKTAIFLLHLPNDESWKVFLDSEFSIDQELLEMAKTRFLAKCHLPAIRELATEQWLNRCAFPMGMDDDGNFWELE